MKNLFLIISILVFVGCGVVQPTYFGDKLPPTTSVDMYYSAHDVKQTYKVIGHLTIPNAIGQDSVKARFKAYAKTIGADAVVITGNNGVDSKYSTDMVNADALKYTN